MALLYKLIFIVGLFLAPANARYKGPVTTAGLNLIKQFEGFRANFYIDPVGIKTIGYGHACHVGNKCRDIRPPITVAQGTALLQKDLQPFSSCVTKKVKYNGLNDAQFSALVSFSFNLGCGALGTSTLLKLLNQGKTKQASQEFRKWVRGGGKVLPGLVRRREAERVLFCSNGGC